MISNLKHITGAQSPNEILFDTPFDYMFEYLCRQKHCKLPEDHKTIKGLLALGEIMGDPGDQKTDSLDSKIPAIYTYFGQFIDHDLTARTDREEGISQISDDEGNVRPNLSPIEPDEVKEKVKNGRRPQLDLDSLFGDGPSFAENTTEQYKYQTAADKLYNKTSLKLKVKHDPSTGYLDINRNNGEPQLADERNAENVMISQLHAVFKLFYNRVLEHLKSAEPGREREYRYARARQITKWVYQFVVVEDYLRRVCMTEIVDDVLLGGARFYQPGRKLFMPLEFSVAAFRFGHSMIRPEYELNSATTLEINKLLGSSGHLDGGQLKADRVIDFSKFVSIGGSIPQMARLIDPLIASGLFDLSQLGPSVKNMMARLTQRNLLRGFLLSLPTGQAMANAMGIVPMSESELREGFTGDQEKTLIRYCLDQETPLWYYVLQEARVHTNGHSLGAVGSYLVCNTIIGILQNDPTSYLNNCCDISISEGAANSKLFKVGNAEIRNLSDFIQVALGDISL